MTTLFMDGFDHYGTGFSQSQLQLLDGAYSSVNNRFCGVPPWGPARTGNFCLVGPGESSGAFITRVLSSTQTNLFISFGFATDAVETEMPGLISFLDASGTQQLDISFTPTGAVQIVEHGSSTVLGTSAPILTAQNWHFIELNINHTSGSLIVRVDDATATNTPALTMTNSFISSFNTGILSLLPNLSGFRGNNVYMDDLFVRNSSGSVNNSWLGDRSVATLFPNSNTSTSGWTPSYYDLFGVGIYTGPFAAPSNSTVQNQGAFIGVNPVASLDIGHNDFTLETWIRWDALPQATAYSSIFSRWNANQSKQSYRFILGGSSFNGGSLQFDISTDGTTGTQVTALQFPWTPQLNTWYHLALCRSAGELLLFINGVQQGLPIADSRTYFSGGSELLGIGQEFTNTGASVLANTFAAARLDETRFTNGVGRYTASFIPPSVAFPRGTSDPDWSDVVLLMGYNGSIVDESSFTQTLQTGGGATAFEPNDGPALGPLSTVNKQSPDDNTFISANLVNATNVFTMTTQPTNGQTVTVGTTDGSTPAVYTFNTSLGGAFSVLIDTTAELSLTNLMNAINAGTGSGTKYGTGTTSNFNVTASLLPAGQMLVTASLAGTSGNSIGSTTTVTSASWTTTTLTGGANIPGPTNFKLQNPPNNTTVISAAQTIVRALKTQSGPATITQSFIGALGGTLTSSPINLTTSPVYYNLIMETDPDTSGAVTPTTIVNGQVQVNRTV